MVGAADSQRSLPRLPARQDSGLFRRGGTELCSARPQLSGQAVASYETYVTRWNAWVDSGGPPDESFRPALNALFALWLKNPGELACSAGANKLSSLMEGLQPGLDQIGALLDSLPPLAVGDPARAGIESHLDAAIEALDGRLQRIEDQLELLGFFNG